MADLLPQPQTCPSPSLKRPFEEDTAEPSPTATPVKGTSTPMTATSSPLSVLSTVATPSPTKNPLVHRQSYSTSLTPNAAIPTNSLSTASSTHQPPAKKRKLTEVEKEAKKLEKEAKEKAKAELKAQKDEEKRLKDEEKRKKEEEREEKKRVKELEKQQKEEEKLKKEKVSFPQLYLYPIK